MWWIAVVVEISSRLVISPSPDSPLCQWAPRLLDLTPAYVLPRAYIRYSSYAFCLLSQGRYSEWTRQDPAPLVLTSPPWMWPTRPSQPYWFLNVVPDGPLDTQVLPIYSVIIINLDYSDPADNVQCYILKIPVTNVVVCESDSNIIHNYTREHRITRGASKTWLIMLAGKPLDFEYLYHN